MNLFGLIRQLFTQDSKSPDLIALPFSNCYAVGNKFFEILEPEWIEDSAYTNTNGTIGTLTGYQCAIIDVSKYDYVILPANKDLTNSIYTGLCAGVGQTISPRITTTIPAGHLDLIQAYACIKVTEDYPYAVVTIKMDTPLPVIGIKEQA